MIGDVVGRGPCATSAVEEAGVRASKLAARVAQRRRSDEQACS